MLSEIQSIDYLKDFPGGSESDSIRRAALTQALDNRKFEIELYWKRATYFWTFIAAAFAAYFVLQGKVKDPSITYVVACLGFIFSLTWYFVNRGSKFWQQNWEMHVDLLESTITGPLYKTILQPREYKFWNLNDAFPFSVSKINQILSLFVTVVWLALIIRTVADAVSISTAKPFHIALTDNSLTVDIGRGFLLIATMTIITIAGTVVLFVKGQTDAHTNLPVKIYKQVRTYAAADHE